jgi:hypothetical protein
MALRALTNDSAALLARIRKLIDIGLITTWTYDEVGDFTHTPFPWKNKAWLRPEEQSDGLQLTLVKTQNAPLTREIFAVYHGRFMEMLIAHVPTKYASATATPNPVLDEATLED